MGNTAKLFIGSTFGGFSLHWFGLWIIPLFTNSPFTVLPISVFQGLSGYFWIMMPLTVVGGLLALINQERMKLVGGLLFGIGLMGLILIGYANWNWTPVRFEIIGYLFNNHNSFAGLLFLIGLGFLISLSDSQSNGS